MCQSAKVKIPNGTDHQEISTMTAEMHSLANDPNFVVEFAVGECIFFGTFYL